VRRHNTHKYCRTESAGTRKPAPALINQHRISGADGVFTSLVSKKLFFPWEHFCLWAQIVSLRVAEIR